MDRQSARPAILLRRLSTLAVATALTALGWSVEASGQQPGGVEERLGRATYSISIVTPPGSAGTGPRLSLQYESSDGHGHAGSFGFGWKLTGLSVIERNTRRGVPFDYDAGPVCNQSLCYLDDFVLDDQDLVCEDRFCSGRYRTRIDDGTRIEYRGELAGWEIQDRSGTRHSYGGSEETRIRNARNGQVASWLLERVEDVHGNWIEYRYDRSSSPGTAYPASIEYAQAGAAANRRVVFLSEPRQDLAIDYRSGLRREIDRRIYRIEVYAAGNELVTAYRLEYRESDGSGRSLLTSVQRVGSDDSTTLPPHRFDYSARAVSEREAGVQCEPWYGEVVEGFEEEWSSFHPDPHGYGYDLGTPQSPGSWVRSGPVDLNRDGLVDLFYASAGGAPDARVSMLPGDGSAFGEQWLNWSRAPDGPYQRFAFTRTSSSNHMYWGTEFWVDKAVLDIDGDGYPDLLAAASDVHAGPRLLGSERGFLGAETGWTGGLGNVLIQDSSYLFIDDSPFQLARGLMDDCFLSDLYLALLDLNADGRPDQIVSKHAWQQYAFFDTDSWLVSLNQGRSEDGDSIDFSTSPIEWQDPFGRPISSERWGSYTVDVNGDGLPDRIESTLEYQENPPPAHYSYRWRVAYNNGAGFDEPEPQVFFEERLDGTDTYPLRRQHGASTLADFFDINGDGFPDHVMIGDDDDTGPNGPPEYYWRVRYGTGSGLAPTAIWDGVSGCFAGDCHPLTCFGYEGIWYQLRTRGEYSPQDFADFNGDGLLDIFFDDDRHIRLNEGPTIDLLIAATQPFGGTTVFDYDTSARMKNEAGEPANPGLGHVLPVVVRTATRDGRGVNPEIVTSYHYGEGVYDYELEHFRGFGKVVRTEHQLDAEGQSADLIVTSGYRTDASCPGLLRERESSSGETVFSRLIWQFAALDQPVDASESSEQWHACLLRYEITETIEGMADAMRARQLEYYYGYDPHATHYNVTQIRDWGEVERFWEDPPVYLERTGKTRGDNRITFFEYALPDDADSHVVSQVSRRTVQAWGSSPPGEEEHGFLDLRFSYDELPHGRVGAGLETRVERWQTHPDAHPSLAGEWIATSTTTYDVRGNAESVTGPATEDDTDGYQSSIAWDPTYQTFRVQELAGSDAVPPQSYPLITTLDYANCLEGHEPPPGLGLACATTDPSGLTTLFGYDPLGRVDRIEHPSGLSEARGYELAEPDEPAESLLTTTKELQNGSTLTYSTWVDGLGRSYRSESPGKQVEATETIRTTRSYDERGRLATESMPHFTTATPETIRERSFAYDALGRARSVLGYDGETRSVSRYGVWESIEEVYFGAPVADNRGSRVERSLDAHGNLVRVADYEDPVTLATRFVVTARYDTLDRLVGVYDPIHNDPGLCSRYGMGEDCATQRHETYVQYDGLGRRVKLVDADSGLWVFSYDAAGLLKKRVDGAGRTQEFEYDQLQRTRRRRFLPSGLGAADASFEYQDDPDLPHFGRLSAVDAGYTSYAYSYDEAGRLQSRSQASAGYVFTDTFGYDALGRITTRQFPDGEVFTNVYDGVHLSAIRGADFDILMAAEYDALGRTRSLEVGDTDALSTGTPAATVERRYDTITGRLVKLLVTGRDDSSAPSLELDLEFDGLSRLTRQSGSQSGSELIDRSFSYDGLGRLVTTTGPWEQPQGNAEAVTWTYGYDPLGNLRTQTSSSQLYERTWTYDDPLRPRFLTRFSDPDRIDVMVADASGKLATLNGEVLSWNTQGRVFGTAGGHTGAAYDAFDRRTLYAPNGLQTLLIYVGSDFEYDLILGQATKFFFVNGERIASRATHYTPETAWTMSWPYRRFVKPILPALLPTLVAWFLLGILGVTALGCGLRPARWMAAPGVALLSLGLIVFPGRLAHALLGGGDGPRWHGGHAQGILIYGNDHLGSTRVVIDHRGETVEVRDYAPFGRTISHSGDYALKHRFTGQAYDAVSDLFHFGARMYRADWGRFISPDATLEGLDSQGLNRYAYGRNSPLSRIDPGGRQSTPAPGVGTEGSPEAGGPQGQTPAPGPSGAAGGAAGDAAGGGGDASVCTTARRSLQVLGTQLTAAGAAAAATGTALASSPHPVMKAAGMALVMTGILMGGMGAMILGNLPHCPTPA
jgi:RHS repeat-associated protein